MRYDGTMTSRGDGLAKGSSTGDFRRARPRYGAVDLRCGGRSALGYDLNTVEFAVEAGVPYAIDFMNPAPDADFYSVGQDNFHWIVDAVASLAIEKARTVSGTSDQIRCLSLLNGEPGITKQLRPRRRPRPPDREFPPQRAVPQRKRRRHPQRRRQRKIFLTEIRSKAAQPK